MKFNLKYNQKNFIFRLTMFFLAKLDRWLESPEITQQKESMENRQPDFNIDNGYRRRSSDIKISILKTECEIFESFAKKEGYDVRRFDYRISGIYLSRETADCWIGWLGAKSNDTEIGERWERWKR